MRHEEWPGRLAAYLLANQSRPFVWGSFDCVQFARAAVREISDIDFTASVGLDAAEYASQQQAMEIAEGNGFDDIEDFYAWMLERAGLEECPPPFAQRGDVVMISHGTLQLGAALGVIGLNGYPTVVTHDGLRELDPRFIARAWKV